MAFAHGSRADAAFIVSSGRGVHEAIAAMSRVLAINTLDRDGRPQLIHSGTPKS